MKRILQPISLILCLLALDGCQAQPPEAYANVGDPERQISVSTEIVTVALTSAGSLNELSDLLAQDTPTQATLNCTRESRLCRRAEGIIEKHNIVPLQGGDSKSVTLQYKRILARDCDSRYVDNSSNPYNLQVPSMGCATRANMVQQVTDKHQFTDPALLSLQDGEKAAQAYDHYLNPPADASASGQGGGGSSSSLLGASSGSQ